MIETLDLQDEGDLVLVRRRVWRWLRALSLDPIAITRLATATSEACARRLEHGPTKLTIELETGGIGLEVEGARWEDLSALLRGTQVSGDRLRVAGAVRGSGVVEERLSMGQSLQLTEREREQARREAVDLAAELERTNQELVQRQEALQRVNDDLEMIAAAVAHDLRQPLHAVSMFGAVLMASEESRAIGEQVKGASERMGAMLEGLMKLARIGDVEETPTKVSTALDQVLADLSTAVKRRGATVLRRGDATVAVGEAHLRVVLQNLVDNAMKYHRDGVPPEIEVRVESRGPYVWVRVVDNGRGLRRSDLRKVTRLFRRLQRDRGKDGAGVGLALVQRVVSSYNGLLAIEPHQNGPGVTMAVRLPIA